MNLGPVFFVDVFVLLKIFCLFVCTFSNCIHLVLNNYEVEKLDFRNLVKKFPVAYKYSNSYTFIQLQNMYQIAIILFQYILMHLSICQNCFYTNNTNAQCNNLTCYNVLKRESKITKLEK